MSERMNIYYNRVVLKKPAPWTDDPILRDYKFTNVSRDMDKLSLYARRHILNKVDEPCDDLKQRKIDVLFNIMIYRLFTKIETYECIGFIEQKNWNSQWKIAKQKLRERRRAGEAIFTSAFMIYSLNNRFGVSVEDAEGHNKLENAITLIEKFWRPMLNDAYEYISTHNMKDDLEYFHKFECVGDFNSYEFCCDLGMITRYCKNHIVDWDNDNYTSLGPGAHRGVHWIFSNTGNLNDVQCVIYLRSIWEHEMKKRGLYDRFVSQLPNKVSVDLRTIEHCLCECQKYFKAMTDTGRPKRKFEPTTSNADIDILLC